MNGQTDETRPAEVATRSSTPIEDDDLLTRVSGWIAGRGGDSKPALWRELLGWLLGVALIAAGGSAVVALAQSLVLGARVAWGLYGTYWLAAPLLAVGLVASLLVSVGALALPFMGGAALVERLPDGRLRSAVAAFGRFALSNFGLIFILAASTGVAVSSASRRADLVDGDVQAVETAAREDLAAYSAEVENMTGAAELLIARLQEVEGRLRDTRLALAANLAEGQTLLAETGAAEAKLLDLTSRREELAFRTERIGLLLNGEEPITRADLERSSLQGLLLGALFGFVASLLASAVWSRLALRFREGVPHAEDRSASEP